jgi:hypothetical protein
VLLAAVVNSVQLYSDISRCVLLCHEQTKHIVKRITLMSHSSVLHISVSNTHPPTHQPAHTDTCKTYSIAYTTVCLRMKPRGSKHVADNRNQIIICLKNVYFVGLCCIMFQFVRTNNRPLLLHRFKT